VIVELFPPDRLLIEDAVTWFDELPTDENSQHCDRENNLSCHLSWLLGSVCCRHFKRGADKLEFRVAERAHFGNVEALQLGRRAHALAHKDVDGPVEHIRQCENDAHQGCAPYELGYKWLGSP
jgi:hypothetical protein